MKNPRDATLSILAAAFLVCALPCVAGADLRCGPDRIDEAVQLGFDPDTLLSPGTLPPGLAGTYIYRKVREDGPYLEFGREIVLTDAGVKQMLLCDETAENGQAGYPEFRSQAAKISPDGMKGALSLKGVSKAPIARYVWKTTLRFDLERSPGSIFVSEKICTHVFGLIPFGCEETESVHEYRRIH
jgi:hypothetical protein